MNYYEVFYWLTVADSVKKFFDRTSDIFSWIAVLSVIGYIICAIGYTVCISNNDLKSDEEEKNDEDARAWLKIKNLVSKFMVGFIALAMITWLGYVLTPTKKDCLLIVAGGAVGNFLVSDSSAKQIPSDVANYLHITLKDQVEDLMQPKAVRDSVKSAVRAADALASKNDSVTDAQSMLDKLSGVAKDEAIKYLQNK